MTCRLIRLCVAIPLILAGVASRAEIPLLRPDELKSNATHVFTGKVREVYRSTEREHDFEETCGVLEIVVGKVEKGVGPKEGEVVYVRFESRRWLGQGDPPPYSSGHHVPAKGAVVRAHAKRDTDGGYEALAPNGLTVLNSDNAKGATLQSKRGSPQ